MLAYHSDETVKASILAQLALHREADQIVKGKYWENGKGCAVGCTLHSSDHMEYEARFGIPVALARLEDCLFEGMPNQDALAWPERFMDSIRPGADLSRVSWQFLHWILTDETINPGINHHLVKDAVRRCADVLAPMTKGEPVNRSAAWSAESAAGAACAASAAWSAESAASAAWSAESAARSAACAARSAASAASAARSAAWSAASAASAARSAASAASAAESAAWSAAEAASAAGAARSAAYIKMASKLIDLIKAA